MERTMQTGWRPARRILATAALIASAGAIPALRPFSATASSPHARPVAPASSASGCAITGPTGALQHVISIQFDNVHFTRDNPRVPSDLEQMPHLLAFLKDNGTLLTNHHTPLISHTSDDILTTLTGVYPARHGVSVAANSYRYYNADGSTSSTSGFTYWTDKITPPAGSGVDQSYNLISGPPTGDKPSGTNAPAPWVPYTRAGCNVGVAGAANMALENTNVNSKTRPNDIGTVFGITSTQAQEALANPSQAEADFEGIALHCAKGSAACSGGRGGVPDVLPDEPAAPDGSEAGYTGYTALFGHKYLASLVSTTAPISDINGDPITNTDAMTYGFPGYGGLPAPVSLGYVAAMQEHGIPVTYAYVSTAHNSFQSPGGGDTTASGPGEKEYVATLKVYDAAFDKFFTRLRRDGIDRSNTLFLITSDEGDHFVGTRTPTPATCDGVKIAGAIARPDVYCTYNRDPKGGPLAIGELNTNLGGLIQAEQGITTPADVNSDDAPDIYLQGNPAQGDPVTRAYERASGVLTVTNPLSPTGSNVDVLAQYLANPTEMRVLHMVTSDPLRTPTLTMFAQPDYYVTGGRTCAMSSTPSADCVSQNPSFAWNHGDVQPEITTTWLGLVGPGVRDRGVDRTTFSEHVDDRPTILALTGLRDDYRSDGRVLVEDLDPTGRPASLQSPDARDAYMRLAEVYKRINAPVGPLSLSTLRASTLALKSGTSSSDGAYVTLEQGIDRVRTQRDNLANEMADLLDGAAFNGETLDMADVRGLMLQGEALMRRADALSPGGALSGPTSTPMPGASGTAPASGTVIPQASGTVTPQASGTPTVGATATSTPQPSGTPGSTSSPRPITHVLLISVDGLHAQDLRTYVRAHPDSALAALSRDGVTYPSASTSKPSDSFPGLLSMVTGGTPKSTGVYYDDAYDRSLVAPQYSGTGTTPDTATGVTCTVGSSSNVTGAEILLDETIDISDARLDGGGGIDSTHLPRDPQTCAPVYPHSFLRDNTIFEVARAAGLRTAWSDKHRAYDLVNGPSGTGVDDLYTPEIAASVGADGTSLYGNPGDTGTTNVTDTIHYDNGKVAAILNEIDGGESITPTTHVGVPAIFGLNVQAVSVGQKAPTGGYAPDPLATGGFTPTGDLVPALDSVDASLKRMTDELAARGLVTSTLVIVTAKHGQAPIDRGALRKTGDPVGTVLRTAGITVSQETRDDVSLIWLKDQDQTAAAVRALDNNLSQIDVSSTSQILSGDAIKAQFGDPRTDPRVPDIVVTPNRGVIYTKSTASKIAEHGGFSPDDTNVALLVSNPLLGEAGTTNATSVDTTQIAPSILSLLGLDPAALRAVRLEGTGLLPGLTVSPAQPLSTPVTSTTTPTPGTSTVVATGTAIPRGTRTATSVTGTSTPATATAVATGSPMAVATGTATGMPTLVATGTATGTATATGTTATPTRVSTVAPPTSTALCQLGVLPIFNRVARGGDQVVLFDSAPGASLTATISTRAGYPRTATLYTTDADDGVDLAGTPVARGYRYSFTADSSGLAVLVFGIPRVAPLGVVPVRVSAQEPCGTFRTTATFQVTTQGTDDALAGGANVARRGAGVTLRVTLPGTDKLPAVARRRAGAIQVSTVTRGGVATRSLVVTYYER